MPRKLPVTIAFKLRIKETLRDRLETAAKRRGASINAEMTYRLERSFEAEAARSFEGILADMSNLWARYSGAIHAMNLLGDLGRASKSLLSATTNTDDNAVQSARAQVRVILRMIDSEIVRAARGMHTT